MVPFDVNVGGKRVGITLESLVWFFVVTAAATVLGELVYDKWVQPLLGDLPNLPNSVLPSNTALPPATSTSNVVSSQTPSLGRMSRG